MLPWPSPDRRRCRRGRDRTPSRGIRASAGRAGADPPAPAESFGSSSLHLLAHPTVVSAGLPDRPRRRLPAGPTLRVVDGLSAVRAATLEPGSSVSHRIPHGLFRHVTPWVPVYRSATVSAVRGLALFDVHQPQDP